MTKQRLIHIALVFQFTLGLFLGEGSTYAQSASALDADALARFDRVFSFMMSGPPSHATRSLHIDAYHPTQVPKLANPRLAFVNWRKVTSYMRQLGFENPPRFLTREMAKAVLDKAGYSLPMDGDSPDKFLDQFITVYGSRYGGGFMMGNLGGGRDGSIGQVNIKGNGRNGLVRPWANGSHSNGIAYPKESIHESLWSIIFDEELPLGANSVLFLVGTGLHTDPLDLNSPERFLIVRDDTLRPAHVLPNEFANDDRMNEQLRSFHSAAETKRMEVILPLILDLLPMPIDSRSFSNNRERLRFGLTEFTERVALQYATAYARQLYHGATSPGNIEISGRFLDFGTATSVIGYTPLKILYEDGENGSTTNIKTDLLYVFLGDLRKIIPEDLRGSIPTDDEIGKILDQRFRVHLNENFLELAGTPKELTATLAVTPEGQKLASILIGMAQAGNEKSVYYNYLGKRMKRGTYDLHDELTTSVNAVQTGLYQTSRLSGKIKDLRGALASYYKVLYARAAQEGISESSAKRFVKIAVDARTKHAPEVHDRDPGTQAIHDAAYEFSSGADPMAIQNYIDRTIEVSVHEFKTDPWSIEVSDSYNLSEGEVRHRKFNLKTGRETIIESKLPGFESETIPHTSIFKPSASKSVPASCVSEFQAN